MTFLDQAEAFIHSHPALMSSPIVWALATAIITGIFRHRTEEELARLPAPISLALRICSAAGVDSAAVLATFKPKPLPAPPIVPDVEVPSATQAIAPPPASKEVRP